ncbi:MAG: hypothetical protein QM608_20885 [Caulobacter sp.]
MRLLAVAAVLSLGLSAPAFAQGTCRMVHGRMMLTNGTPSVRIRVDGAKVMLGVVQQDETFGDLPANLRRLWGAQGDEAMWSNDLTGDFEVCPVSKIRAGEMQTVRVRKARGLKVRPRD